MSLVENGGCPVIGIDAGGNFLEKVIRSKETKDPICVRRGILKVKTRVKTCEDGPRISGSIGDFVRSAIVSMWRP